MKNMMWKKMLAAILAAVLVFPTVFQGVLVFASEISEDGEVFVEQEVPEEEKMSIREVGRIPEGVVIAGMDVGGMTGEEVYQEIAQMIEEKAEAVLTLQLADEKAELELSEVGLCWKNEGEVAEAMHTAITGNLVAQYKVSKDIEAGVLNTALDYSVDREATGKAMQAVINKFGLEPKNAEAIFNGSGFDIQEDVPGVDADVEEAITLLVNKLEGWKGANISLEIPADVVEAEIQTEYYDGIGLIAEFTTDYWSDASSSRNVNVQLGAKLVDGNWFAPGDKISLNEMIGDVSAESGFELAGAFIDGDTVDKYGGGLCQVATTVYNCFLKLELEGVTRKAHSKVVEYVPYSFDAAISPQDGLDLVYINNTGHPLYIQMYTEGDYLTCKFYGVDPRPEGRSVDYRSVVLEKKDEPEEIDTADPSMKPGTVLYTRGGYYEVRSQLWKDVYEDGVLVDSVRIHSDYYAPLAAIRYYGPAYDKEGTAYYINNDGYAEDEEGYWYRLNPDGTFLDDPTDGYAFDVNKAELYPNGRVNFETETEDGEESSASVEE